MIAPSAALYRMDQFSNAFIKNESYCIVYAIMPELQTVSRKKDIKKPAIPAFSRDYGLKISGNRSIQTVQPCGNGIA